MERRQDPRVRCRVPVELYCPGVEHEVPCRVHDLSFSGLFATGQPAVSIDSRVEVVLRVHEEGLRLNGRVVRSTTEGVAVEFGALTAEQTELLNTVMWPRWDGRDLLEGVMILADDSEMRDLGTWMRLTSVIESFRRHLPHHR